MPRRDPARAQRARERKEAKAREKARKASEALTETGRQTLDVVLDGGRQAQPSTNLPKAIKDFDAALDLKQDNADALFFRGRCYMEQGQVDKALADYVSCITHEPTHIPALMQQAICYDGMGDSESAINNFTAVINIDPRNDTAYNLRGCAMLARRGGLGLKLRHVDFVAVESDFLSAVRCNENNFYALCNLGRLYDEHGQYEKAVDYYTRAMQVKDDYSYAAYRRGCAALTAVEEALRKAERAADLDPTAVVLNESCAAVPFSVNAPRDPQRVEAPKSVPPTIFSLPPISSKSKANQQQQQQGRSGSAAMHQHHSAAQQQQQQQALVRMSASELKQAEMEKQAKKQIEKEMAEEKQFAQLKQFLTTAVGDFSRIMQPLVEAEDRVKELPALLHRAKAYLFDGDLEKAEDDANFVRKSLGAYEELQPPPPTSLAAVKNALGLLVVRIENCKQRRRQGVPISPFASGASSLHAAILK